MKNELISKIKLDEGFKGTVYKDSRGFPTIGYGTLLPITEIEAELLLEYRLDLIVQELINNKPIVVELPDEAQNILYNMAYNMGVPTLLKFKKMWRALEEEDFKTASAEMEDSRWYHQVGDRAKELVQRMYNVNK